MKTLIAVAALILSPSLALAMGCSTHETATNCPTGQVWNGEIGSCVDVTT